MHSIREQYLKEDQERLREERSKKTPEIRQVEALELIADTLVGILRQLNALGLIGRTPPR